MDLTNSTSISSKSEQYLQEYKADTNSCHEFLGPYTRLMKEGYRQLQEVRKSLKEESLRRELPEKEYVQILIKKIGIFRYHINYLENIMGTIETSYCLDNVNANSKKNKYRYLVC